MSPNTTLSFPHLCRTAGEHGQNAETHALDRERRAPFIIQDRQANVSIRVNVRVQRRRLRRGVKKKRHESGGGGARKGGGVGGRGGHLLVLVVVTSTKQHSRRKQKIKNSYPLCWNIPVSDYKMPADSSKRCCRKVPRIPTLF